MGLPWYRVHTVVINDPGRLLAVHLMHTALLAGWAGSMALYELAIFDPSDAVLNPMWRQGMYVMPFMARLGITSSWNGWDITGATGVDPGFWSFEGVAAAHIVFSGLLMLASIWVVLPIFLSKGTTNELPTIFVRSTLYSIITVSNWALPTIQKDCLPLKENCIPLF